MERDQLCSNFQFPAGFRFHPSDEELIVYYLRNKVTSRPLPASVIAEINLYKYNPWELPKKALFGEDEWYFFSPRDRKYPNGVRPNRAAGLGYWKATGIDKPILTSAGAKKIGVKKGLVFYTGRPPKGEKTDWTMNEYRLQDSSTKPSRFKGSMRLDDWVLCRIRNKGKMSNNMSEPQESRSPESMKCVPKIEQPSSISANYEMITDCIYKDCPLLAYILTGQAPPPIDTISSTANFEGSQTGDTLKSVYRDASAKVINPITLSLDNYFNLFNQKSTEENENGNDNLLSFNKNLDSTNKDEDFVLSKTMAAYGFNAKYPMNSILEFEDLNGLALTGADHRYLQ